MHTDAATRPDPTTFRKAMITTGSVQDHAGKVEMKREANFDINRTIFKALESAAARAIVKIRLGRFADWKSAPQQSIEQAYTNAAAKHPLPEIDPKLIDFLVSECDFNVEHADGSFLDHLYFCLEFSVHHYPDHSPLVMFLHSIMGVGTNTFPMPAEKIPELKKLLSDFDFRHIEAFPSTLRLIYCDDFYQELLANQHRADKLKSVRIHRVIDNQPIELSGDDLWIQLNYQLMHLMDFLPPANLKLHQNDSFFIAFRRVHEILTASRKLTAKIDYDPATHKRSLKGEILTLPSMLDPLIPTFVSRKMAEKSIRNFSAQIGHSLDFKLEFAE